LRSAPEQPDAQKMELLAALLDQKAMPLALQVSVAFGLFGILSFNNKKPAALDAVTHSQM
jgi:hypothetical protein